MKKSAIRNRMRPIHPGEILGDELVEIGISARTLAAAIDVPPNRVTKILNGERSITADTALRLECYFGGSAEFWMSLQSRYELATERLQDLGRSKIVPYTKSGKR